MKAAFALAVPTKPGLIQLLGSCSGLATFSVLELWLGPLSHHADRCHRVFARLGPGGCDTTVLDKSLTQKDSTHFSLHMVLHMSGENDKSASVTCQTWSSNAHCRVWKPPNWVWARRLVFWHLKFRARKCGGGAGLGWYSVPGSK
jgi:hypothetical protein